MQTLAEQLSQQFPEVEPLVFYKELFSTLPLEEKGHYEAGQYCGICLQVPRNRKEGQNAKRVSITRELEELPEILASDDFCLMAPISYAGKQSTAANARWIYALAFDLDGIEPKGGLGQLLYQFQCKPEIWPTPTPTYLVASGNGLHLYYFLEKPIPCYKNVLEQVDRFRHDFVDLIWNDVVTTLGDSKQYESAVQKFRCVGTLTKSGKERVRAFKLGERISLEELNKAVDPDCRITCLDFRGNVPLEEAKELYPHWYQKRVVEGLPPGHWHIYKGAYDKWLCRIRELGSVGHRYHCVLTLAVYGIKANVPFETVRRDAYSLLDLYEQRTETEDNHFTADDIESALQAYNEDSFTYSIESISYLTGIYIERNKRNGRTQSTHLYLARGMKRALNDVGEGSAKKTWLTSKNAKKVREYLYEHPEATIRDIADATGLSKDTAAKWAKEVRTKSYVGTLAPKKTKQDLVFSYLEEHPEATVRGIAEALQISTRTAQKWAKAYRLAHKESN